ncbi:MAG TPA: TadE family type IV pilus minor pilin [Propionibacteriaceae bacterium]
MVTVELAVSTLAVLALLTMLCWGIFLVVMQLRCVETAAEVARQAARGDNAAVQRAKRDAPTGARVEVRAGRQVTSVVVRLNARPFTDWLVVVPLHAEAEVLTEPPAAGER